MTSIAKKKNEMINQNVLEDVKTGMFAWLVQRITAILLIVFVPLKLLSGYIMVGDMPGPVAWAAGIHSSVITDVILLLIIVFHLFYGIRVILVDFGWVKSAKTLFYVSTVISVIFFTLGAYIIVS